MTTPEVVRRRRWPFVPLALAFGVLDLFVVLVLVEGALDTKDTEGRTLGMILVGVVVALLT